MLMTQTELNNLFSQVNDAFKEQQTAEQGLEKRN